MVKISNDVVWMVIKSNNAYKVQRPGAKARKICHSSFKNSSTGLFNASSLASQYGLQATKGISKSKKGSKTTFDLLIAGKQGNKTAKVSKNQWNVAKNGSSAVHITNGANKAAKCIGGLTFANDKVKTLLKRRLYKLQKASARSAQIKK